MGGDSHNASLSTCMSADNRQVSTAHNSLGKVLGPFPQRSRSCTSADQATIAAPFMTAKGAGRRLHPGTTGTLSLCRGYACVDRAACLRRPRVKSTTDSRVKTGNSISGQVWRSDGRAATDLRQHLARFMMGCMWSVWLIDEDGVADTAKRDTPDHCPAGCVNASLKCLAYHYGAQAPG